MSDSGAHDAVSVITMKAARYEFALALAPTIWSEAFDDEILTDIARRVWDMADALIATRGDAA